MKIDEEVGTLSVSDDFCKKKKKKKKASISDHYICRLPVYIYVLIFFILTFNHENPQFESYRVNKMLVLQICE